MFKDRFDAGRKLVPRLGKYQSLADTVVIGLPRGGVVTAYEVAKGLKLPLDVVCPRKIGAPMNPEFAIGAITETGEGVFNEDVIAQLSISKRYIEETVAEEKREAAHRIARYRSLRPPIDLKGKRVLLVDDGLATGSTMKAAIRSVRALGADQIIVAVPVSPLDTLEEIRALADEVVCLDAPPFFQAVGQFYEHFDQTTDAEVVELIKRINQK